MKNLVNSKFSIVVLLILILSIISSIGVYTTKDINKRLTKSRDLLSDYLTNFDSEFEQIIKYNTLDTFNFNNNNHLITNQNSFVLILYRNDEATFWTKNSISFPNLIQIKNQARSIQKLKNVWSYVSSYKYNDTTYLVAVLPIKYTQDIKNNYLTDEFIVKNIDEQFDISTITSNKGNVIFNHYNESIFSIYTKEINKKYNSSTFYVLVNLLLLFSIFYFLFIFCEFLITYIKGWFSFIILIALLLLLRYFFVFNGWFYHLQNSILFDPSLLGSNFINTSLGTFIINSIIFGIISYYFYKNIRIKRFGLSNNLYHLGALFIFTLVYISHILLIYLYKDVIVNSTIPLDLTNILKINSYSIIVYSMFAIISFGFIFMSLNIVKLLNKLQTIKTAPFIFYNAISIIIYSIIIYYFHFENIYYLGLLILLIWILLVQFYFNKKRPFDSVFDIVIILAYVSLVTSIYSNYFHIDKSRIITQDTINKLSDDRDYVTEFSFTDIHCRVTEDAFLKRILQDELNKGKIDNNIINRIKQLYFKSYLSKYNLDIHLFDKNEHPVLLDDTVSLSNFKENIDKYGFETSDFYLHFIEKSSENYFYSAIIPVYQDTNQIGLIVFELKPKISNDENVYPELLISKNIQKIEEVNDVSYLVINNNRILKSKGSIPYEYTNLLNKDLVLDSFIWLNNNNIEYAIYKPNLKKSIIYSKEKIYFYKYISSYSYILILYILISFILFLFFLVYSIIEDFQHKPWKSVTFAFHDKINFTLFSLLIFSFFAIAIITTFFINYQYESNNKRNLINISIRVSDQLQEYIVKYNVIDTNAIKLKEDFSYLIPQLSNDEKIDINLFDLNGQLAISSQSSIFEKGLQANKMNPEAFTRLKNKVTNQVLQNEAIGKLTYLSLYMPLYNDKNQLLAYMNIPYFSQTKTLRDEISRFLVALINVYVPLLLITGLLALLISNSLTKPLNQISNQLRKIRLGKVNESIEWHQKDEIGLLVDEYNKMILKLDESANSLKKSEREGAWREMAKQIAHEIKNPLTPMRLSIQYLQRAIQEKNPNTQQLTLNMTHTLIEQIDNLSEIATAFSSFAQMPVANNEKLDLDHYLMSIINLFAEEHNVTINYFSYAKPAWIYADKNQMISLFNNLIKNAIQAIHEDSKGVIDIYLLEEYGTVKTIIMDNGKGIAEDIKANIFTPNFTTKNSGSGLGLAISKQIIENAGGAIWFESVENFGTSFYVVIPKYVASNHDIV